MVRVSVSEPGYVWEERRSVRWVEPPGEIAYLKAAGVGPQSGTPLAGCVSVVR